jgi:DNA-binding CsgD family transcriptional regulator
VQIFAGELDAAASLIDEVTNVTEAIGSHLAPYGRLILAAWRGQEPELSGLIEATVKEVVQRGEGIGLSTTQWLGAVLNNGLGQYENALAAAQELLEPPTPRLDQTIGWVLPELIEAAARSGQMDLGRDALAQLADITSPGGSDWALGIEARSRALVTDGPAAEALYQDSIERLGRTRIRPELARAHLLYGEWLRRENRRVDARAQLRAAHDEFMSIGMEAFAERARGELLATGEHVRRRTVETREDLTPQERQIAQLARDGLSNSEIGERLFLSQHTVAYHLRKVFTKLDITSRNQLGRVLPRSADTVGMA